MEELLVAVSKYGFFPVLFVVLLMLVYMTISDTRKHYLDRKDKQQKIDAEAKRREDEQRRDETMLKAYKDFALSLFGHSEHSVEEEKKNNHLNEFIYKQLNALVEQGADRAYMMSYHNGGKDLLGRGFQKMSITAESVDHDIPAIMTRYQQLPRALFPVMYASLEDDGQYDVSDAETVASADPMTYQYLADHGAQSAFFRALKRSDGVIIGFIAAEYVITKCDNIAVVQKNIDKVADRITGALLGFRDDSAIK